MAAAPAQQNDVELFTDDFSRFAPGLLSAPIGQLNGAIQEYHYIEHRGVPTYPWRNPIVHLDSWAAGDEGTEPYLEQHLVNDDLRFVPLFVTGDPEWRDYRVDQTRVWIYTQDRPFRGTRIYQPTRSPDYNDSNYRSTVSLPGWGTPAGSK